MLTETWRVCSSWVFSVFLAIARSDLGINLMETPLLGTPGHCVNTPECYRTANICCYRESRTCYDQLMKCISLAAPSATYPLNSYGSSKDVLF